MWITNQLHQPLCLCAAQDRILQVIAVFTKGLQTSLTYPLLRDKGRVSTVRLMSDSKPVPLFLVREMQGAHQTPKNFIVRQLRLIIISLHELYYPESAGIRQSTAITTEQTSALTRQQCWNTVAVRFFEKILVWFNSTQSLPCPGSIHTAAWAQKIRRGHLKLFGLFHASQSPGALLN